jgi:microcystin-dependent protein
MAKTKVSEWSAIPANNTDVGGIDINEGCAPSGINNAIRDVMAQIKDMQTGADGDNFAVSGTLAITGGFTLDGAAGTSGQVMVSAGSGNTPTWGNAFVAGMIMMWSGSIASIPSGWLLCNGSSGTPDLRNRFVVGAGSTYAVGATGGSADAIVVSHTHSASSSVSDPGHNHTANTVAVRGGPDVQVVANFPSNFFNQNVGINNNTTGISVATSVSTTGSSGTNANLPPYYALAYIMKA